MKQKIYIPSNFPFIDIIANIENICKIRNFELIKTSEKICIEHTLSNRSALSLLSPLGYGLGVKNADFRIVPTKIAAFVGYSSKSSMFFKQGLKNIEKIAVNDTEIYLVKIAQILLSERYDIEAKFEKTELKLPDILKNYDSAILYEHNHSYHSIDISEDWFETYEIPLIAGLWVVRNEEEPIDVIELTESFAINGLEEEIDINHYDSSNIEHHHREGKILTQWNDEIKNSFEQTLELLYYHRLLPEIPSVKIYGID